MKNYRFYGEEMEILGQRLDAARVALANAKSPWAKNHWQKTVDVLLSQWRKLPILHDGEAQMTIIPRWEIDYSFYEKPQEISRYGLTDRLYESFFNSEPDLDWSWENNREKRLARAQ